MNRKPIQLRKGIPGMTDLASSIRDASRAPKTLAVKGLSSTAAALVGHRLGKGYVGYSIMRTNPTGREKYLYSIRNSRESVFIQFASLTAATVTYYVSVF